jgi:hypothetical protein
MATKAKWTPPWMKSKEEKPATKSAAKKAPAKKAAPAKKMYGGTAKKMAKGGAMKAKC